MTGRRNNTAPVKIPGTGSGQHPHVLHKKHPARPHNLHPKMRGRLGRHRSMSPSKRLPLFNVHSPRPRHSGMQAARSSIIELSQLPKMMVPAHQIERIVTNTKEASHDSAKGNLSASHNVIKMANADPNMQDLNITVHLESQKPHDRKHSKSPGKDHMPVHNKHHSRRHIAKHKAAKVAKTLSGKHHNDVHHDVKVVSKMERNKRINGHSMHAAIKRRSNNATDAKEDVFMKMQQKIKTFATDAKANQGSIFQSEQNTLNNATNTGNEHVISNVTSTSHNDHHVEPAIKIAEKLTTTEDKNQAKKQIDKKKFHTGVHHHIKKKGGDMALKRNIKSHENQGQFSMKHHKKHHASVHNKTKHVNHVTNHDKKQHDIQHVKHNMTHDKHVGKKDIKSQLSGHKKKHHRRRRNAIPV